MSRFLFLLCYLFAVLPGLAQSKYELVDKFRQLEEVLPTPNVYRTASGAPGHAYWQQRADYIMKVELDEDGRRLKGSETITYTNNSPDALRYLWLQLDQNRFAKDSESKLADPAPEFEEGDEDERELSIDRFKQAVYAHEFEGGYTITNLRDAKGKELASTVVKTMLRLELPQPLKNGEKFSFSLDWSYTIPNAKAAGARAGWEYFDEDKNNLFELAQFFPRLAAYTDVNGWQHKQFLGDGEFTLEFGNYEVAITVPADHVVSATGVLQNPDQVLTATQRERLQSARTASKPVLIVTEAEATANESSRAKDKRTWIFRAENVRDFAWVSSRKFIWDAQGFKQSDGSVVMAQSLYPKEGNPLWERYSTAAIIHTLEHYAKYTFLYPYPTAISVNGPVGGMEYPMICFNGPRPEKDKTYSQRNKYGLISVVIHEVGHNFFPMIVNSDERQWTWMDEGLNSFLQFLAECAWEEKYPSWRGVPAEIVPYMLSEDQVPIMTNSESLLQFGNNAYGKPATALNILRETIMGRDLFDYAFREYSRRWAFKRPEPADFFRSMEDASGIDLDWFWRGWFYTTDHVDLSIDTVHLYRLEDADPDVAYPQRRKDKAESGQYVGDERNKSLPKKVDAQPELKDFYNEHDKFTVTPGDREDFEEFLEKLKPDEKALLDKHYFFYVIDFSNHGGLVMPLLLEIEYLDGERETVKIPAEIWRYNHKHVSKLLPRAKEIKSIALDPKLETADTDMSNNDWPRKAVKSRFHLFKEQKRNLMQRLQSSDPKDKDKDK